MWGLGAIPFVSIADPYPVTLGRLPASLPGRTDRQCQCSMARV